MRKLRMALAAPFVLITIIWFLTNTFIYSPFDYNLFTKSLDQYTGIIAFTAMTCAMLLAARPMWLEKRLHGLDKMYRLHKWLGILAFSFAVLHWLVVKIPVWSSELENLVLLDAISGATEVAEPTAFEAFFDALETPGAQVGLYAFYATVLFLLMALLKKIPYRIFAKTHIVMAVIYLALVFHAFALMYTEYWTEPIGIVMAIMMIVGAVSAFYILFGQAGKKRRAKGIIQSVTKYTEMNMLEVIIKSDKWKGHKAGQFAFLKFEKKEPPHPFTISSAWDKSTKTISFSIKALGDYTNTLADKLKVGDGVAIEGAYGGFTFNDIKKRQIWIGGGVGITPFLSRMERLTQQNNDQNIDFFYAAYKIDDDLTEKLQQLSTAANINLHIFEAHKSEFVSGEQIRNAVSDWKAASVWFCGPSKMGKALNKDLKQNGYKANFHKELFEMR